MAILAAQIEVRNVVARILLSCEPTLRRQMVQISEPFLQRDAQGEARLAPEALIECKPACVSLACASMYQLALDNGNVLDLIKWFHNSSNTGPDGVIAALECTRELRAFKYHNKFAEMFVGLCKAHVIAIQNSQSADSCAIGLMYLAELLDSEFYIQSPKDKEEICATITDLRKCVFSKDSSPSLSNAWVRFSGWLMVFENRSVTPKQLLSPSSICDMEIWGTLLSESSLSHKV
jgi:hypothetical protein